MGVRDGMVDLVVCIVGKKVNFINFYFRKLNISLLSEKKNFFLLRVVCL